MSFPPRQRREPPDDPRVEREAAEWVALRYQGLSPAQAAAFERWLRADSRHAAVFHELEEVWRGLDRVRLPAEDRLGPPDPDLLAPRRPRFFRVGPLLAAAAALAVAWLGWSAWTPAKAGNGRNEVAAGALAYSGMVATEVGHLDKLALPDGSIVRINTDSRVEVAYSAGERRVRLVRGEAYFTVAKDATRPFVVDAAGVAVRAVGTAFNVRLRPAGVDVLVTEGTVRVSDPVRAAGGVSPAPPVAAPGLPLLQAGERLVIPVGEGRAEPVVPVAPVVVPAAEMARALAWQDQRIDVVAVPLAELVAEFNRYNSQKLVVADAALGERRFGGSFRVDAPETFARLLETRFGLRVERRGQVIVISP
ncbi:MAG: hypothetical protein RL479_2060 [Verrucomicrobiota bacterium]